jgi:hypothetical protein
LDCEAPFGIVPSGRLCITKPKNSWTYGNSTTYVYTIGNDPIKPVSYLCIYRPSYAAFPEGLAATIYGQTAEGVKMGDQYFIGDPGPEKMSRFFHILLGPRITCITIFIVVRPKPDVDEAVKDRNNTGLFTQLCTCYLAR